MKKVKDIADKLLEVYSEEELIALSCIYFPYDSNLTSLSSFINLIKTHEEILTDSPFYDKVKLFLDLVYHRIPLDDLPLYIEEFEPIVSYRMKIGR